MRSGSVDVLIPAYNAGRFVREAVDSIRRQDHLDVRIVVVDDGSTDDTPALLAALAREDARIVVITQPNGGIVDALNNGLGHCEAEFIARFDADDIAYPHRLARQVAFLRENPDIVATAGIARLIDADGRPTGELTPLVDLAGADPGEIPAKENYLLHPLLMIRRAALVAAGGYRRVVHAEDADLYWRLREQGRLANQDDIQGEYRIHPASITASSVRNGRLLSVSSQLAALSALRRRAGRDDLAFTPEAAASLAASADRLDLLCRAASVALTPDEARHLRFAAAAKLMEQSAARPYEPDLADCTFFRDAWRESGGLLSPANRAGLVRAASGRAVDFVRAGEWAKARTMLNGDTRRAFLIRLAVRMLVPAGLYGRVRAAVFRWRRS